MGFGWSNAIHPDDREPTIKLWAECVASGKNFQMQHRLRRHDGVYRVMSVSAVPSRDASGKIVEWIGMHTDITQRVEAETALREANSRFQKLYDANLIGICYPDRFGAFSDGNAEFLRIVGYTAEELHAGRVRWDTMTPPEYAEIDRGHIAEAASRGSCTPYEKEYFRKDGTRVPILCGYALRDGSTDQYIGFIMDLSRLKQTEDALRRSEKLAATGRLAASIAHEINNPLESVTNSLYLGLSDPTLTDTTRSYLELAERELARVAHVATQTLRFHRQSTAPASADLGEIMDSAFALFAQRFEACSIKVTIEYCTERRLFCFVDEIRQVFANLLSNALDAMRPGGQLRLRIRNTHDWRGEMRAALLVSVADTGHGIPAKVQEKIFEPFMTTKDATGTGLGLWVSDGIVKKHKGRFLLRSSTRPVGHGTVFWIYFPLNGIVATK
jgi:PAS domain S-box-containing protein